MNQQNPSNSSNRAQILYFSHGGGPMPLLHDPTHAAMNQFMETLPNKLHRPDAIVVFSAHWEAHEVTLQSSERPSMLYDYFGFPKETYEITYPAPGNPNLVSEISHLFEVAGIPCQMDASRGFDHGLFIPLLMMYPAADIPCFQISLLRSLDSKEHMNLGIALRPLLEKNILFIGSGFSFHNLRAFNFEAPFAEDLQNEAFQDWLLDTCCSSALSDNERTSRLNNWEMAPFARYCHPREEHLLPLHICYGLANAPAEMIFDDTIIGKRALAFLWR